MNIAQSAPLRCRMYAYTVLTLLVGLSCTVRGTKHHDTRSANHSVSTKHETLEIREYKKNTLTVYYKFLCAMNFIYLSGLEESNS